MIRNRYEADSQEREDLFKIIACLDIITTEAAQILADNGIDFSCFDHVHHSVEFRSFKTGSFGTVIGEHISQRQIRSFLDVLSADTDLILDGIPVIVFTAVFYGQSRIDCRAEQFYSR